MRSYFRGERIEVPSPLRKVMKEKVHAGHIGINSSLRRARDLIYWPQMSTDIRHYVETCGVCATYVNKQSAVSVVMADTLEYFKHFYLIYSQSPGF